MTDEATLADQARKALDTIRKGWPHVLDPIGTTSAGTFQTGIRPATEDEREPPPDARLDTPRTLAFWVHAALDEWPTILQTLQADANGDLHLVTTQTLDCTDVPAMAALLHREAGRITEWVEPGHDYGRTFVDEVTALARAVERVAWPPKDDRLTIGECPQCRRRVRVKAPAWHRPDGAEWEPDRDKPIVCRCGLDGTIEQWCERIVGPTKPLTADQLVVVIRERMGLRYQPLTIRTWQRRGMIKIADYANTGHARYDVTQVLAALIDREKQRDRAS